jgi:hypothetical protein
VIAAAGDIACDPSSSNYNGGAGTATACRQRAVSDLLVDMNPAAVLSLGDHQYDDDAYADYLTVFHPTWGRVKGLTHPVIGNHEYRTAGAAGYFDYFNGPGVDTGPAGARTEAYYSFDVGGWHLIALNTNCARVGGCDVGSAQYDWLRADLAANPAACTLAFFHHPRFTSGSAGNTTSVAPLWRALHGAGADVILNAHSHGYERFAPQAPDGTADPVGGIRQFVVGTGGHSLHSFTGSQPNTQVRSNTTYGVLELSLEASGYAWRFVPVAGSAFTDSGTDTCH